jgi:hypothetical protein
MTWSVSFLPHSAAIFSIKAILHKDAVCVYQRQLRVGVCPLPCAHDCTYCVEVNHNKHLVPLLLPSFMEYLWGVMDFSLLV